MICSYKEKFKNLEARIAKTLSKALNDQTKPHRTHYGAIIGITSMGAKAVQLLLLPQLPQYVARLENDLKSNDYVAQIEAEKCYKALLVTIHVFN